MSNRPAYQSKYGNSWALVIGVNAYQYASPLEYATNDARAIAELLEARFGFPRENISLLLDNDATADAIRRGFLAYHDEKTVQPDDRLLVFFAGHGHTIAGRRGEVGFLVPADGHTDRLNTLMAYVYDRVARDQYSDQTPHYGFVDGDGDFIFDTSPLDTAAAPSSENSDQSKQGDEDVLINVAPELVSAIASQMPVVEILKGLLSDPGKKIKLDDVVTQHVRRALEAIDLRHFPVEGVNVTQEEFLSRVQSYEESIKDIQQIVILLAQWGEGSQLRLLEKIFRRLAEADKGSSGRVVFSQPDVVPAHDLNVFGGDSSTCGREI